MIGSTGNLSSLLSDLGGLNGKSLTDFNFSKYDFLDNASKAVAIKSITDQIKSFLNSLDSSFMKQFGENLFKYTNLNDDSQVIAMLQQGFTSIESIQAKDAANKKASTSKSSSNNVVVIVLPIVNWWKNYKIHQHNHHHNRHESQHLNKANIHDSQYFTNNQVKIMPYPTLETSMNLVHEQPAENQGQFQIIYSQAQSKVNGPMPYPLYSGIYSHSTKVYYKNQKKPIVNSYIQPQLIQNHEFESTHNEAKNKIMKIVISVEQKQQECPNAKTQV
ncbi:UNKNOWN [Stylonychia lemnae]|uniref:Uncharacterized protein n=1 Tax=Stylonychia lemnae TaxID=5949 RepID=A0A077ZWR4_STYLE|nr:UNKNOWN [Stylonychia lemnae]|eukprot:CDW72931.1 UNKNOWN [Stylonychia lemnae]